MTLQDAGNLAQVIGVLAVMSSLIFVGIEVRQNSAIARARSKTFRDFDGSPGAKWLVVKAWARFPPRSRHSPVP